MLNIFKPMASKSYLSMQKTQARINALTPRDRLALLILVVFLIIFVFVVMILGAHGYYKRGKLAWQKQQEMSVWMTQVAPSIKSNNDQSLGSNLEQIVSQSAAQQGLTPSTSSMNTNGKAQLQVNVNHPNYAVLAAWLTRLDSAGVRVDELQLKEEPNKSVTLTALLSRS